MYLNNSEIILCDYVLHLHFFLIIIPCNVKLSVNDIEHVFRIGSDESSVGGLNDLNLLLFDIVEPRRDLLLDSVLVFGQQVRFPTVQA